MNQDTKQKKETANAYQTTGVMTSNRKKILLMVYEGAIRFLKQAIETSGEKDFKKSGESIIKTQNIINELRNSLNFEAGKEVAVNLDRLYSYILECLAKGNTKRDPKPLGEALEILTTLNEGWQQAIAQQSQPQPQK